MKRHFNGIKNILTENKYNQGLTIVEHL